MFSTGPGLTYSDIFEPTSKALFCSSKDLTLEVTFITWFWDISPTSIWIALVIEERVKRDNKILFSTNENCLHTLNKSLSTPAPLLIENVSGFTDAS